MHPTLKNVIAVILGLVVGNVVNMGIVMISGSVIPLPENVDVTSMEALKGSMSLFEPKHFIMPFLAHALGTLFGAITAAAIAAKHNKRLAVGIGIFFLIGGIINAYLIHPPTWFIASDLILAYLPMGLLGGMIASKK